MASSGVYVMPTMTARDLIVQALRELKVLAAGQSPEASEIADGVTALNGMLLSWGTYSALWRDETITLSVDAGVLTIALSPSVRNVTAARVILPGTVATERQMTLWEPDEYADVPVKTQVGTPIALTERRGRDARTVTLWPVPSQAITLLLDVQLGTQVVTEPTQTIDVSQEWLETVWTNLAVRIAGSYGSAAELTPELVNRATSLLTALRDDDRPASYFAGPDYRRYG